MTTDKEQIVELFNQKVKGKDICLDDQNSKHCGKERSLVGNTNGNKT